MGALYLASIHTSCTLITLKQGREICTKMYRTHTTFLYETSEECIQ